MLYLLCPVWVVFQRVWDIACSIFSFSADPAVCYTLAVPEINFLISVLLISRINIFEVTKKL